MICISSSMCGLFGLLRSPLADHPERASEAFVTLGTLAEERGRDSAGVALLNGRPVLQAARQSERANGCEDDRRSDMSHTGVRVIKGRGRFSGIWRADLLDRLDRSPIAMGHTRWATQGSPFDLLNASPLVVPDGTGSGIVATHNGDVEAGALRARHPLLPPALGTTDSEPVFQLLAGCRGAANVTGLLGSLVGRAALAWVDRARPDRVHLARAALSPLTVAVDTEQNFYWASNPRWLAEVERHTKVRFASAVMLREGTYLQVGLTAASSRRRPRPRVLTRAGFVPTARDWDLDDRVWTGFTAADMARDRATLRHRVISIPAPRQVPEKVAAATAVSPEFAPAV
ncbi:hypothetical protein [Actinomadura sp. 6N118]|uniref:hypothetical protein n=1 Tax=Actinomadura sp. 6N118 TaxID=3375151 RepID=UPI003789BB26